jgi:hypothetical protein
MKYYYASKREKKMKKFAFEEMIHYHIQEIGIERRRRN